MFVSDFQVSQGVLLVDTPPIAANHISEPLPTSEFYLLNGDYSQENLVGAEVVFSEPLVLKLSQKILLRLETAPGDVPWPTTN